MLSSSDRLDRIEQLLERMALTQRDIVSFQEQQQGQIQILANAAADYATRIAQNEQLIARLDAIIERLVYREGRNGNGDQPQP